VDDGEPVLEVFFADNSAEEADTVYMTESCMEIEGNDSKARDS
jgi:hypothetical protein